MNETTYLNFKLNPLSDTFLRKNLILKFPKILPLDDWIFCVSHLLVNFCIKIDDFFFRKVFYFNLFKQIDCNFCIIKEVFLKREIQQVILTAINLDIMSEQGLLLEPLQTMVYTDQGTFGVDEVLIHSAQLFGAIGIANAFQLDKDKPGIIGKIDKMGKSTTYSCTFLDDILCVVCGSAMGKIAHSHGLEEEEKRNLPKNLELLSQF